MIMTFGNKILAGVIKLRISKQMILDLGWALNPMIDVLLRASKGNLRHREKKRHVKMEAGIKLASLVA